MKQMNKAIKSIINALVFALAIILASKYYNTPENNETVTYMLIAVWFVINGLIMNQKPKMEEK